MRQHRALRIPGRSRGVDDRRDVLRLHPSGALLEDAGTHFESRPASVHDGVERRVARLRGRAPFHEDDVIERRALRLDLQDFAQLLELRDEHRLRSRVLEQRRDLRSRKRRVDGDGPRSGAEDGVVGHRPLRPVLRNDRDALARLDSERVQAEREGAHGVAEIARGDRRPPPSDLGRQEIRLSRRRREEKDVAEGADLGRHVFALPMAARFYSLASEVAVRDRGPQDYAPRAWRSRF